MAIDVLGRWALRLLAALTIAGALFGGVVLRRVRPVFLGATALAASLGGAALDPGRPAIEHSLAAGLVAAGAATLAAGAIGSEPRGAASVNLGRRRFLAGLVAGVGMLALGGGALWRAFRAAVPARFEATRPLGVQTDPAFDRIGGLSPLVTPREDHYVVDVDLVDPIVAASGWRLTVEGQMGPALALSLGDLLDMPTVERLVCMSCISNPVGGALVSDSIWTGVPVRDVLGRAGLSGGAATLVARGADGYFETIPLDAATLPFTLVAVAMDGALLPREHGYPLDCLSPVTTATRASSGSSPCRSSRAALRGTGCGEDGIPPVSSGQNPDSTSLPTTRRYRPASWLPVWPGRVTAASRGWRYRPTTAVGGLGPNSNARAIPSPGGGGGSP